MPPSKQEEITKDNEYVAINNPDGKLVAVRLDVLLKRCHWEIIYGNWVLCEGYFN